MAFYGSKAIPKQVFGEGDLLDLYYKTIEENTPYIWELNNAFLGIWDNKAIEYKWILPDNFHCNIKVMGTKTENIHLFNSKQEVTYAIQTSIENGRSLGANSVHSIDGMIIREIYRRCSYNPKQISDLVRLLNSSCNGQRHDREQDQMVITLWSHYKDSGFLSARILQFLDHENVGLINKQDLLDLIHTFPTKPFQVLTNHD